MTIANVKLIFAREVRNQFRDRRTLFMIFVLPVLLYPLLGTVFFQMLQFRTQSSMTVRVVGGGAVGLRATPLIEGTKFSSQLFADGAQLLELDIASQGDPASGEAEATRLVQAKKVDAALIFPPDFAARLQAYRWTMCHNAARKLPSPSGRGAGGEGGLRSVATKTSPRGDLNPQAGVDPSSRNRAASNQPSPPAPLPEGEGGLHPSPPAHVPEGEGSLIGIPRPKIIYTEANERSLMAYHRLTAMLDRWTEEVGKTNLVASGVPAEAARPFEVESSNLAGETVNKATNVWSRMLPVLLLLWAMTGAFYPAIDLCAGEKERGTLETLLSSPAERSEIVLGKLLTIMSFSMITAALNLVCGGVIGALVFRQQESFGGPPPLAILWLSLALVPVSALFSALCLALAAFARSTKEGQYYLMPLLMLTLPLAVLPVIPGVELGLGNSLIPISGLMLLLKTLLEGSYLQALQFLPIVLAVTMAACWLAVRWAVEQFNKESVIFRESERFAVGLWLRRLMLDRGPTPSAPEGLVCGLMILVLCFVFRSSVAPPEGFDGFARVTVVLQLAVILTPALLMAVVLTGNPRQTLLLRWPRWKMLVGAAVLAVAMHPFILALNSLVMYLYPIAPEMKRLVDGLQANFASANLGLLILCVAAVPALCEELAFRGFILSGCRNLGSDRQAILLSAIFFGLTHGFLQQSINACLLGLVLGYLAVKSGSLLPGVVFHFLHNATTVLSAKVTPELLDRVPVLGLLVQPGSDGPSYQWPVYLFGGVTSLALLGWFTWFPEARSPEEVLQEVFHDEGLSAARG